MTGTPSVERDERTVAVENASYRWAYLLLSYGLLLDVMYRSLFFREAAWDAMALVIGGGLFCAVYQGRQNVLSRSGAMKAALVASIAAVLAAIVAYSAPLWSR